MRIKDLRISAGMSQVELAERMKVGQATIAGWESGDYHPSADKLPQLADALHCSIDALFGREAANTA